MPFGGADCRWLVTRTNREYVEYVSRITGLSNPVAQVLINRGVKTPQQIDSFLNPGLTKLGDAYMLPGMDRAVQRVGDAARRGEKILVHGDYDADGITATAIMMEALGRLGADARYYIPERGLGYGFGAEGIRRAREAGASLIITVDCGITSFEAVSAAKSIGIDVIVTDHHEPVSRDRCREAQGKEILLPDAAAVINPKLMQGESTFAGLSGAGVAFNLARALLGNSIDNVYDLLDLAALGTSADVVPLVGDNRVMLKEGLKLIQSGERIGIRALKEVSSMKSNGLKVSDLQYILAPRINSAGRIAEATDVVRLFLSDSYDEAAGLASWLNGLNARRQEIGESVFDEAMEIIRATGADSGTGAIVVAKEGWHSGVLGIVAAKIVDAFYRPAFVFSIRDGIAKGSARSIAAFDIHEGLSRCKDILRNFGGHKQAAGLSLPAADVGSFRSMISRIVLDTLPADELVPALRIDAPLRIPDVSNALIEEIARLEPFGYGNEEPVFGARGLEVVKSKIAGNNHLKMYLRQDGRGIDSIGFDLGRMFNCIRNGSRIDAAFLPVMNEWDGGRNLQLNLKAVRMAVNGL